ncbi:hypothetical protein SEA_ZION_91 [Corynebacterium phage Zion]|uniref:Uncharacterized protein n=3 Tax=Corynebacterium virus Zion TaxID=2560397 RepID=A0A2H4P909_9CAUD|nr:hypothetical protein FDJ12_gp53 [Corynebacterium phage Zion]ATW58717.1 hypothetical protein SEA_POTATOCHIP_91 [Corynebacterium phage PotatoChip]ATW58870.1 hypothetical protein SEA_ZION_91 [Corynebacterium phage Zion]AYR03380.1 hypothetical protein PETEYPAB_90 [Corynebacterium phage PeteyPab]
MIGLTDQQVETIEKFSLPVRKETFSGWVECEWPYHSSVSKVYVRPDGSIVVEDGHPSSGYEFVLIEDSFLCWGMLPGWTLEEHVKLLKENA